MLEPGLDDTSCNNKDLDIAFVVDCSRSMKKHVIQTKETISSIIRTIKERFDNNVRLAFVSYTDLPCKVQTLGFTDKIEYFKAFAENQCRYGTGS